MFWYTFYFFSLLHCLNLDPFIIFLICDKYVSSIFSLIMCLGQRNFGNNICFIKRMVQLCIISNILCQESKVWIKFSCAFLLKQIFLLYNLFKAFMYFIWIMFIMFGAFILRWHSLSHQSSFGWSYAKQWVILIYIWSFYLKMTLHIL